VLFLHLESIFNRKKQILYILKRYIGLLLILLAIPSWAKNDKKVSTREVSVSTFEPDSMPKVACNDRPAMHLASIGNKRYVMFKNVENEYPEPEVDPDEYLELTVENLYKMLDKYQVKFKKIVMAQALLETGYFQSDVCLNLHNLFGLRHPSDGSYYEFDNWTQSVKAYRDDVQYKYLGGDYYRFLDRIGYAEDKLYTSKVRRIANTL
jgi:hypothetical protein